MSGHRADKALLKSQYIGTSIIAVVNLCFLLLVGSLGDGSLYPFSIFMVGFIVAVVILAKELRFDRSYLYLLWGIQGLISTVALVYFIRAIAFGGFIYTIPYFFFSSYCVGMTILLFREAKR